MAKERIGGMDPRLLEGKWDQPALLGSAKKADWKRVYKFMGWDKNGLPKKRAKKT